MTEGAAPARRAALVYNPVKVDSTTLRATVAHYSAQAGWRRPLFFATSVGDLGQAATRRALADGADVVLVAGGDGTVRAVAEVLAGTGVPMTIVPSGTGNLLARNLSLPLLDPDAMVQSAFTGATRAVDIGIARILRADDTSDEHAFVVMAGMGLDAAMIANTRAQLKRTMGWVAYVDGAARSLPGATPFRVEYELDGERPHSARVQSILFANCGTLPAGIALIPDGSVSDGLLDVAVIQPAGWLGWIGVWRKVWWDNSVLRRTRAGRRIVERRRGTSVHYLRGMRIETVTEAEQPVELDGDGFGMAVGIHCHVVPGGLLTTFPRR